MALKKTELIKLPQPIEVEGAEPITQVEMIEPYAGEMRGLKFVDIMQGDMDAMAVLIPRICPKLTERHMLNMSPINLTPLIGGVLNFFVENDS
tara:strand:+ start:30438 stop:30716 length:279 start_codon:yes stop_codon:yes gene_type:complete